MEQTVVWLKFSDEDAESTEEASLRDFFSNSEASASELLEIREEMSLRYWYNCLHVVEKKITLRVNLS